MASGSSVVIITSLWAAPLSRFCSGFAFKLVWPSSDLPHQVLSGQRWSISLISSEACIKHHVAFAKKETLSNLKKVQESTSRALMNSDFPFSALSFRLHRLHTHGQSYVVQTQWDLSSATFRPEVIKKGLYFKFKPCKTHLQRRESYHVVLVSGFTSTRVTRRWG